MAQQPRQQRIGFYGKFTPTTLDTSEADKMRALAGLGQTIADTSLSIAKPMVTAERAKQGAQAVKEGAGKIDEQTGEVLEAPEMAGYKIGSAQYNQAAQQALAEKGRNAAAAYQSAFRTDTKEAIAKAKIDFKDDPVGFQNWTKSFTEGSLNSINDPAMKAQANEYISERTFDHQLKLQETFDNKLLNEQIATVTTEAQNAYDEAERLIIRGDAIGARMELDTAITGLQEVARMNPNFDVESAVAQIERDYDSLQLKASVSDAADSGDFPAANEMLIEARKEIPKNFTEAQWEQAVNKAQSALVKQKSLFDSTKQVATNEDRAFFQDGVTLLESGKSISVADRDRMNQIAGDDPVKQKAITTASNTSVFIAMPKLQQNELLESLDDTDPENVDQIKSYLMARNNIEKSLRADSWGTAVQQNVITEEEQADFAEFDVTALLTQDLTALEKAEYQEAYKRNEEIAARLTEHYGYKFAPFNNQQVQALSNAIPNMSPSQKVELVDSIGPDSAVWGLLVDKGDGLFSTAATIENPDTQRAIFLGDQKLATAPFGKMSEEGDMMDTAFYDVMGDTLNTVNAGLTYKAALAHYASTFEGEAYQYNESDFKDSIRAITGKVETVRGKKTIPPSYSKGNNDGTVDNLEGFFDDMDAETFEELGGKLAPYTETRAVGGSGPMQAGARIIEVEGDRNLDKVKGNYRIKAVNGKNNYSLIGPNGTIMTGADGNALVINVNEERMSEYLGNKYVEQTASFANRMMKNLMPAAALQGGNVPTKRTPVYQSDMDQGMTRPDGSVKSEVGYLGPVVRDDGGIMTEFSIGVKIDGVETLVPSMIPTLTKAEVEVLRTLPEGENPPEAIQAKAADYARRRIAAGLNPFYQDGE